MAVAQAAKIVAGKIAEQVAIQAAAELLLRRILGGGRARPAQEQRENPIADMEISAIMNLIGAPGGEVGAPAHAVTKRRPSKYNLALKAEMKKMKTSRMPNKKKFALAAKRASKTVRAAAKKKGVKKSAKKKK